jgi:hypothetical protein
VVCVALQNLVTVFDLERHSWVGGRHAARSYSLISPLKTFRRRILAVVRSLISAALMSSQSGGTPASRSGGGLGPPMRYLQTACGAPRHAGGARWFPDTITVTGCHVRGVSAEALCA